MYIYICICMYIYIYIFVYIYIYIYIQGIYRDFPTGRDGGRLLPAKRLLIPSPHLEKFLLSKLLNQQIFIPPSSPPRPPSLPRKKKSISYSLDTQVMLILILTDIQYSQKTVFSFEKVRIVTKSLLLRFSSPGKRIPPPVKFPIPP